MIFSGAGYSVVLRNVEVKGVVQHLPVEFFVFVPSQDARGGITVQVVPLVLRNGELVAAIGKLEKKP